MYKILDIKLALAMPGTYPLQQISVPDISAFAAAVIGRREAVFGLRYDIAGDELSGDEAAAILTEVTGRNIRYEGFPPDVWRAQSEDMALMYEWFIDTGLQADISNLRHDFAEVKWHDFESWTRRQDWSVLKNGNAG